MAPWAASLKDLFNQRRRQQILLPARQRKRRQRKQIQPERVPLFPRLHEHRAGGPVGVRRDSLQCFLEQAVKVLRLVGGFGDLQQQLQPGMLIGQLAGFTRRNGLRLQARGPLLLDLAGKIRDRFRFHFSPFLADSSSARGPKQARNLPVWRLWSLSPTGPRFFDEKLGRRPADDQFDFEVRGDGREAGSKKLRYDALPLRKRHSRTPEHPPLIQGNSLTDSNCCDCAVRDTKCSRFSTLNNPARLLEYQGICAQQSSSLSLHQESLRYFVRPRSEQRQE